MRRETECFWPDRQATKSMSSCQHEDFEAICTVNRLEVSPERPDVHSFAADLRIRCFFCLAEFGFKSRDVGLLPDRPAVSVDALELRAPLISPSELELLGPLAAMVEPLSVPGFRVRNVEEE